MNNAGTNDHLIEHREGRILIIAEMGNLHEGSLPLACAMARCAVDCGADAVKFQTHVFDAESLDDAPGPSFFQAESRKDYLTRTALSPDEWRRLKDFVEGELNARFMTSVFSIEAAALMADLGMRWFKIPSGEVNHLELIRFAAETAERVFVSSGMSSWAELDKAVALLKKGRADWVLMQCTSRYPCPPERVGLNVLAEMRRRYGCPIGFSDHTMGTAASLAAATLGATVIERHFTLSRFMYGSDAAHSLEPHEFRSFVAELRALEAMLSHPVDKDQEAAALREMKDVFEKSVVTTRDLAKGRLITRDDVALKKPGTGIKADQLEQVLGRRLRVDVGANTMLTWEDLE